MTTEPERARELLRACHDRRLEREGIPMVLALVDERPGRTLAIAPDAESRAEGGAYADLLADYSRILTPPSVLDEGDEGGLITAMQVLAYEHFGPGATS
jgi:hypothetical protein